MKRNLSCHIALPALAMLILAGPTGASANAPPARPEEILLVSYADRVKAHATWPRFPIRVFFKRDALYTTLREKMARAGFSRWVEATRGFVDFAVTTRPEEAQLTVRFDAATNNGYTTTHFTNTAIKSAEMAIGVKRETPLDVQCIAAHESGHALGIEGHSDVATDVMYPVHKMTVPWAITERDLSTLATLYRVDSRALGWKAVVGYRPAARATLSRATMQG